MQDLIDYIKANCTPIDREARFDQMLDECYSFEDVGGPFAYMVPSQVLKEMDPTAYRCEVNDYMDGEDTYEIVWETYDMREVDEARDEFVGVLEDELSILEGRLSDMRDEMADLQEDGAEDSELESHAEECDEVETFITDLERRINEAKSYQF